MKHSDSKHDATENLRQTLEFLSEHQLFPTAINYAVGYEYVTKDHPNNRNIIDLCLAENGGLSDSLVQGLFEQLFFRAYEDRLGFHNELEAVLRRMLGAMTDADTELSTYGEALAEHMDSLSTHTDAQDIERILTSLIIATQEVSNSNQALHKNLHSAQEEGKQLRQELEKARAEAITDALTGLLNRNALDLELPKLLEHAAESRESLSVLMVDIDHFKRFNDSFGHQVGDHVLRHVAGAIKKVIRGSDYAVRYGGEEFLVILPDTPDSGAMTVAQNMCEMIESLRLVKIRTQEHLPSATVSVGVASWQNSEQGESLISRADQALYQAKERGRNRVVNALDLKLN